MPPNSLNNNVLPLFYGITVVSGAVFPRVLNNEHTVYRVNVKQVLQLIHYTYNNMILPLYMC